MPKENFFPEIVTNLPEADIPIEGVHSHLFQGENQQFVFMSFESDAEVPEHSHEAQWGVILHGEIELTLDCKKFTLKKGDTYFIPKDVKHSARIRRGYKDLTLFDQKDRYKVKQNRPSRIQHQLRGSMLLVDVDPDRSSTLTKRTLARTITSPPSDNCRGRIDPTRSGRDEQALPSGNRAPTGNLECRGWIYPT